MIRATASQVLAGLLEASHLVAPGKVAGLVVEHARGLRATDATIYLADYEQRLLVPVPSPPRSPGQDLAIDGTVAGRAFRALELQQSSGATDGVRLWVPLLDGTERVGVLALDYDGEDQWVERDVRAFAGLVALLVMSKLPYGDIFELVRRRQTMSLAAELAWQLLPPLTFGTERVVISGALVPPYDLGGDTFDYAVDEDIARIAVFDAMGHGLEAGLLASVAMAACRNSRRARTDLVGSVAAIDGAIAAQFGPDRFVTAVLADLDLDSGRLQWTVAGHPPPLLLRNGRIVKTLVGEVTPPLGIGGTVVVSEEVLEPGDQVLFFTDGVVEARSSDGEFFGLDRLVDLVSRTSAAATPAPETMRRLLHAILDHQKGELQDDATIVLVEWRGAGSRLLEVQP